MMGRRPKVFPNGTHQMLDAPSIRLLTAINCVSLVKGMSPVGGPLWLKVAQAVTSSGNALLMMELDTLVVKAYSPMQSRMVIFRQKEKFRGSAGSGDGSLHIISNGPNIVLARIRTG